MTKRLPHLVASLVISITKLSIMIDSPHAYSSHNRCMITLVSSYYRCPICTVCNWIPVINYMHFNGCLHNVSFNFLNLGKALQTFSLKRSSHKTFLIPKFVIFDTINYLVIGPHVILFRE